MFKQLSGWQGRVVVNGTEYENIGSVPNSITPTTITLLPKIEKRRVKVEDVTSNTEHLITVKQYMTKPASPEFDFMDRFNKGIPMPLRTMQGIIEKETKGMYYMKLHGQGLRTVTCLRCGRELTNPISRYHGIGPECVQKLGMCFAVTDVEKIKEALIDIKWDGYVIKSAILEDKIVEDT